MDQTVTKRKKMLGKYYTPESLAQAIVDWVVKDARAKVLEPSFGGCTFLRACLHRLEEQGAKEPGRQLFGVDVDPRALDHLARLGRNNVVRQNFVIADFMALRHNTLRGAPFDVIVANPPFVRFHSISKRKLSTAKCAMKEAGFALPGRASYWAYFLVHSLSFLRVTGTLAMILPLAFLMADYSRPLQQHLLNNFGQVHVVLLSGRVFPDAQEATVVLFADKYGQPSNQPIFEVSGTLDNLRLAQTVLPRSPKSDGLSWRPASNILPVHVRQIYERLRSNPGMSTLGQWVKVRLGVVSGANDYFILTRKVAADLGISGRWTRSVVTRAKTLRGLSYTREEQAAAQQKNERSLLLVIPSQSRPRQLRRYLSLGERTGIAMRFKCSKRKPWYSIHDAWVPDAFLHYMCSSLPHLVVNNSDSTCTNAIHRLTWNNTMTLQEKYAVAVASVSSLSQLSCELVGRNYAGGLLKLEPTAACDISLPVPPASQRISATFTQLDALLRQGRIAEAVEIADEATLLECFHMSASELLEIRRGLRILMDHRQGLLQTTSPVAQ
jgi:adenine-specific DNA-methyltransferase